jgi:hypothetical protein
MEHRENDVVIRARCPGIRPILNPLRSIIFSFASIDWQDREWGQSRFTQGLLTIFLYGGSFNCQTR